MEDGIQDREKRQESRAENHSNQWEGADGVEAVAWKGWMRPNVWFLNIRTVITCK